MEMNNHEHKELQGKVDSIREVVIRNDEKYNAIFSLLGKMQSDIEYLKGRSGKRWDSVITAVITAIIATTISGLVGWFLAMSSMG